MKKIWSFKMLNEIFNLKFTPYSPYFISFHCTVQDKFGIKILCYLEYFVAQPYLLLSFPHSQNLQNSPLVHFGIFRDERIVLPKNILTYTLYLFYPKVSAIVSVLNLNHGASMKS